MKKIISIILALATLCCMTALVACNNHEHEYDHACDTKCNTCGATREISYYTTGEDPTDGGAGWVGSENIDSVAGGQYVFKIDAFGSQYPICLTTNRTEWSSGANEISEGKYSLRFFDKDFNELNVKVRKLPDVEFLDGNGADITEQYEGKVIYLMVTLSEAMTFCPYAN